MKNIHQLFNTLILPSISDEYSSEYTRISILYIFILISILLNILFSAIDFFFIHDVFLITVSSLIVIVMLYALYTLYKHHNYIRAAYIGTFIFYIAFLMIAVVEKGDQFTLIWTYFLTPFALITLETKYGLRIIGSYLVLLFLIAYTGVGHWQNGLWSLPAYFRFVASHLLMLYVIYTVFDQYEKANMKIIQLRSQEKKQREMLEKLSQTDPLTGLRNRRSLQEHFIHQLHYARAKEMCFAFFLLDIDFFKDFNDTYGHKRGDELLTKIAHAMERNIGEAHAFRIGGDEFAGILATDTCEALKAKLTELHQEVSSLRMHFETDKTKPLTTVSVGAHIVDTQEDDFTEIFEQADVALYLAKAEGRNRIVFH